MLLLVCDLNTLLILLNCWWIELKIKLCQLGFLPKKGRKRKWSSMFETIRGTTLLPQKVYLVVVLGSRNLSAIQNKCMLMWSGLKKSQFWRQPFLSSFCFEHCPRLHIKPSAQIGAVFQQFRAQSSSEQELGTRTVLHLFPFYLNCTSAAASGSLLCFLYEMPKLKSPSPWLALKWGCSFFLCPPSFIAM